MSASSPITLYDTTLRDGAQGEGIHFSLADKLRIAQRLDAFGMHYIEGGWPGSNEKDIEFFREAKKLKFAHARLAAFGSTRRANTAVEKDAQVALLLEAGTPVITLVCKASVMHVTEVLRTTPEENLAMIRDTIRYLVANGREVIFDGEHTFDGYKEDPAYTTACYQAADEAGASYLVLCDTNGGSLPSEIARITGELLSKVKKAKLGIHTHDDCGLGVANALAGIEAGATQIQGTINGYGERTGNCNLVTAIANLQLKMNLRVLSDEALAQLRDLSLFVDEVANQRPSGRAPFVGSAAFAHKGGIHVNAVNKLARSYEHIEPARVGNHQRVLVGELAGRANIMLKARTLGLNVSEKSDRTMRFLQKIKRLENKGYEFEAADASLKLLLRKGGGHNSPHFKLLEYHVSICKSEKHPCDICKATVKLSMDGKTYCEVEKGDGPVNALDAALRKALRAKYPELSAMRLVDYKVRIIDSRSGTAAKTRVFIESTDGSENWTTVGVSHDIIEASWIALSDSFEYALTQAEARHKSLLPANLASKAALKLFETIARDLSAGPKLSNSRLLESLSRLGATPKSYSDMLQNLAKASTIKPVYSTWLKNLSTVDTRPSYSKLLENLSKMQPSRPVYSNLLKNLAKLDAKKPSYTKLLENLRSLESFRNSKLSVSLPKGFTKPSSPK